jgi:hypothetical protein
MPSYNKQGLATLLPQLGGFGNKRASPCWLANPHTCYEASTDGGSGLLGQLGQPRCISQVGQITAASHTGTAGSSVGSLQHDSNLRSVCQVFPATPLHEVSSLS